MQEINIWQQKSWKPAESTVWQTQDNKQFVDNNISQAYI